MVHVVAVLLGLIVTMAVVGSVCATEGALRHSHPARWGFAGAMSVLAGGAIGGLAQTALTVAPIAAVLAIQTAPRTHEGHIHELSVVGRHHQNLLLGKLSLVLAVVLLPYAAASGFLESAQRTDTARPTIVSTEQQTGYGSSYRSVGHLVTAVTYTFVANGRVHAGKALRTWSLAQIGTAKVCYDPNDINGSHSLELPEYTCGSFDLHPNG